MVILGRKIVKCGKYLENETVFENVFLSIYNKKTYPFFDNRDPSFSRPPQFDLSLDSL